MVASLFGLTLLSATAVYFDYTAVIEDQHNELEKLREENKKLRVDNSILTRYKDDLDQLDERIANLKSRGYKPDELLLRYVQRKSKQLNIDMDFAIHVLEKESSMWANTDGPFGELGGFQILPSTLYYYAQLFGLDSTQINLDDYRDIRTNTEWAYFMFLDMKYKRKRLEWKDWNVGFQEPLKPSNVVSQHREAVEPRIEKTSTGTSN